MLDRTPLTTGLKANFSDIYNQPDPRAYFATLSPLEYQIPQQAQPVIARVRNVAGFDRTVLDVCCSYGINGALLRYHLDIDELASHYLDEPAADLAAADAEFFAARRRETQPVVFGLDAAPNAVAYAKRAGLIVDGWAENLEADEPSAELAAGARDIGMIICTGGVGYVGAPTFRKVVGCVERPQDLWLVVCVLRTFTYDEIAAALGEYGLVTEQLPGLTLPQRRFATTEEQQAAIEDVRTRGLDPTGKESDGWFHAECYVSRSAEAAKQIPIDQLLPSDPR